jgi:hypothetical protein
MISSFSAAWYGLPIGQYAFFEQPVLEQHLGQQLLQLLRFRPQPFNFVAGGFARGIASQPFLACLQKLLRAAKIQILIDAFLAAQLRDAFFAASPAITIRTFSSAVE